MKSSFSNDMSTRKGEFLKPNFIFCLCYQLTFDDVIDDMIYMISTDSMLDLDDIGIENIYSPPPILENLVKESIRLLHPSFRANTIMCFHGDIICFNCRKIFIFICKFTRIQLSQRKFLSY